MSSELARDLGDRARNWGFLSTLGRLQRSSTGILPNNEQHNSYFSGVAIVTRRLYNLVLFKICRIACENLCIFVTLDKLTIKLRYSWHMQ